MDDVHIALLQGLAFGIFYATVGLPLGLLADRISRRTLVTIGVLVWSLATIGGGFAASFGALFTSRLLVGLGEAALGPAAVSLIADLFPPDRRGRPLSVFLAGPGDRQWPGDIVYHDDPDRGCARAVCREFPSSPMPRRGAPPS